MVRPGPSVALATTWALMACLHASTTLAFQLPALHATTRPAPRRFSPLKASRFDPDQTPLPPNRLLPANTKPSTSRRWASDMPVPPPMVPVPFKPELGVGRNALLEKVLLLTKGPDFVRVKEGDTVLSAVKVMNDKSADCCLVFKDDDPGQLAGIFTERDYVRKVVEAQRKTSEVTIGAVMTPASKIISASPKMRIGDCMSLMVSNKVRHIPVIDPETSNVLGVISTTDLVKTIKKDDESLAGLFPIGSIDPYMVQDYVTSARETANALALQGGGRLSNQDYVRGGFVAAASFIFALLLQGNWLHDHEVLSMVGIFLMGYVGIILENIFEFNKAAVGLLMATALWVIYAGTAGAKGIASAAALGELGEHVSEVSEIIFFLLGAMTIVEIVDAHQGFRVVTDFIKTNSKKTLMWTIGILAFFMSSILDNLTTTIVMISLLRKLIPNAETRKLFGALVVIAANAGGAWTPIGDVTTTMLWINGQITAVATIKDLVIPSAVSLLISTYILQSGLNTEDEASFQREMALNKQAMKAELAPRGRLVFFTGLVGLLSVPVFKALTGLPPYLGMLSSLGVLWVLTDAIHAGEEAAKLKVPAALSKIDVSGILFFFGILLSIGALDSAGILQGLATYLQSHVPSEEIIATVIGMASAVIDNVPLVAATMGMYDINSNPQDSTLWQLIAYCAGTGGSLLVIGSAAGVALMGMEKVDFLWYAKKATWAALAGYLGGIATYMLLKFGLGGFTGFTFASLGTSFFSTLLAGLGIFTGF